MLVRGYVAHEWQTLGLSSLQLTTEPQALPNLCTRRRQAQEQSAWCFQEQASAGESEPGAGTLLPLPLVTGWT